MSVKPDWTVVDCSRISIPECSGDLGSEESGRNVAGLRTECIERRRVTDCRVREFDIE